jgi:hypothetical protein
VSNLRKITLKGVSICLLLVCNIVAGYGQNTFTNTFIADSRPSEMLYLGLTQTKDSVSGSLTIVTPDGKGRTKSNTLSLRGTTDGDSITLIADKLFENLAINGRKQGETVVLMFPTNSGNISNVIFTPTTQNNYNLLLKKWQEELTVIHNVKEIQTKLADTKRQEELAAISKEKESLTKFADTLFNDINLYTTTGIKYDIDDIQSALDDEKTALRSLEIHLADLRQHALIRPMTCYQAYQVVGYDFNQTLGYDYSQSLGLANNQFTNAIARLEKRLSNVEPLVEKTREDAQNFDRAIKNSKYPIPKLRTMPKDELKGLELYQALSASAHDNLPTFKITHTDNLNKAKKIMREGEIILNKTQSLVRCS